MQRHRQTLLVAVRTTPSAFSAAARSFMPTCGQAGAAAVTATDSSWGNPPSLVPVAVAAEAAAEPGVATLAITAGSASAHTLIGMEVSAAPAPTAAVPGWSAWELKPYMNDNRNWQAVSDFWAALVRGDTRLSALGLAEPHEFRMPPEAAAAGGDSTHAVGQERWSDSGAAAPGARVRAAEDGDGGDSEDAAGESAAGRRRRQLRQDFGPQRTTYKVDIAYQGSEFAGWAFQANRRTVQGTLEAALPALLTGPQYSQARQAAAATTAVDTIADGTPRSRTSRGSAKRGPAAKVVVSSAGRTDAGVSGYGMPISFYAWHELSPADIAATIAAAAPSPGSLRALAIRAVPRQFHATFSASWRRYVYLFPLRRGGDCTNRNGGGGGGVAAAAARTGEGAGGCSGVSGVVGGGNGSTANAATAAAGEAGGVAGGMKQPPQPPRPVPPEVWCLDPDVALLHELLAALRGRPLDYLACARDTPPGKDGICTLHVCRASVVELPPLGLSADDAWATASDSKPPQPGVSPGTAAASAILGPGAAVAGAAAAGAAAAGAAAAGAAAAGAAAAGPDADAGAGGSGNGLGRGGAQATAGGGAGGEGAGGCGPVGRAGGGVRVMAVELVGSRFLKRMVRVLVSTALREATPGAARYGGRRDALLQCFAEGRDATGMPAPAAGLCFAGAGYPQELLGADS